MNNRGSSYKVLLLIFFTVIFVVAVVSAKKNEKLFGGGGARDSSHSRELESSEEDFELNKFNLNDISEFFHHFKGSKRCGKLGRRILKDTHRLFHPAADHRHINRKRCSHHLSQLYSRYSSDCCSND